MDSDTKKVKENELKCANCQQNHASNYSQCPKRIEYKRVQETIRSKNLKNQQRIKPVPAYKVRKDVSFSTVVKSQPTPSVNDRLKWPSLDTELNCSQNLEIFDVENILNKVRPKNPTDHKEKSSLFSYNELMTILSEALSKLNDCQSKSEQFHVIIELASKYLFSNISNG
jgi:hypothetical protein